MSVTKETTSSSVRAILLPILEPLGIELVDIENGRIGRDTVLRIFIDKEGGITLDDCANVSHELSAILDVEDVIPNSYTLEVSSPGLDRPLKTQADYERFTGRLVKIRTYQPLPDDNGNKRKTFLGTLDGLTDGAVKITLAEGQTASIPLEQVAKANLEFEL